MWVSKHTNHRPDVYLDLKVDRSISRPKEIRTCSSLLDLPLDDQESGFQTETFHRQITWANLSLEVESLIAIWEMHLHF